MHPDFSKLHEHPDCTALLRWADVFVMYNPGFGNSNLQASWDPSIRLLLETRKPLVFTAYGAHDLQRDLHALDRISAEADEQELGEPIDFVIPPHENPFKTLKCTVDSREEGDEGVVITNFAIYAVQAK
jgi:splicing suppressor protein 51